MEKISCVIPCYRSEKTIENVVDEIIETINSYENKFEYEIILINDNSPDNVWEVIKNISKTNKRIIGLNLAKNFGQHSALMAGYVETTGDYIVTLDDDGQTPASEIFNLIEGINDQVDVVYGKYAKRKDNIFRKLGTKINNFMSEKLIGKPKNISLTSFFAAKRYVIDEIIKYTNPYPYIWGLVVRTTTNIANVTVSHRGRVDSESGYTLKKLLRLWINGFTAFSVKPLRIASVTGLLVAFIGFFVYYIYNYKQDYKSSNDCWICIFNVCNINRRWFVDDNVRTCWRIYWENIYFNK